MWNINFKVSEIGHHLRIILTLLSILACSLATFQTTIGVGLKKQFCAQQENLTSVHYVQAVDVAQCSQMFLLNNAIAMLIVTNNDGSILCGLSLEFPTASSCANGTANVEVYGIGALPLCTVSCDKFYTFLGEVYCLHKPTTSMTYDQSVAYCDSHNGTIAEADTMSDVVELGEMISNYYAYTEWIFVGAKDHQGQRVFTWNRGDTIRNDIWLPNEPNTVFEMCVAIGFMGVNFGVLDIPCEWALKTVCTIRCREV